MLPSFVKKSLENDALLHKMAAKNHVDVETLREEYTLAVLIEEETDQEVKKSLQDQLINLQVRIENDRKAR